MLPGLLAQQGGILHGRLGVMDGARPDDDQQSVILTGDDPGGVLAGLGDDLGGPFRGAQLMQDHGRGQQGELGADTQVVRVVVHRRRPFPKEKSIK